MTNNHTARNTPAGLSGLASLTEQVLQMMPLAVLALDKQGILQLVNPEAARLLGRTADELQGQALAQVVPASFPAELQLALQEAIQSSGSVTGQFFLSDFQQWIEMSTATTPTQLLVFWHDITRLIKQQNHPQVPAPQHEPHSAVEAQTSEALLSAAEQAAQAGSYEVDLANMTFRFSGGMFLLFGEEPQSFVPNLAYVNARSHPEDAAAIQQILDQAILNRTPYYYRRRIYRSDGQQRTLEAHGNVLYGPSAEPVKLLGTVHDVTERDRAEAELHSANRTIQRMLHGSPAAICLLEARRDEQTGAIIDFVFRGVNRAAQILNQKSEAELLGHGLLEFFPGVREVLFERYVQVVETGDSWRSEQRYSGEHYLDRWFDVSAVKNEDGIILTFLDITAQKQTESQLQQANAWLTVLLDTGQTQIGYYQAVRDEAGQLVDFTVDTVNSAIIGITSKINTPHIRLTQVLPGIKEHPSWQHIIQVMETGEPQRHEEYYDFPDVKGWFDIAYHRLEDGFFSQSFETTSRKQVEQELVKNLALLQQSEEIAQIGSWEYEVPTGAFRWSAGMYRLFGLPLNTPVTPSTYQEKVIEEDVPVAEQLVRCLIQGTGSVEETLRIRVDGQVKTLRIKAHPLHDEHGQLTRILGIDLDISQVKQLEAENLHLRLQQQQRLFDAVLEAQEVERKRIAESLHNGVGQLLYATKLRLDQLRLYFPQKPVAPALVAARREADQLLAEAISQTRALSHELMPTVLKEFGLATAVQDICRHLSSPSLQLHGHVVLDTALPPNMELALYRMTQELAQNIVKHAEGATEASLEVETTPGFVLLRAADNGLGFIDDLAASSGLGLRSIRDRVQLLGGTMEINSAPASGSYVRIRLPLPGTTSS
ncbi:PAS domain-containing protein [Hymenobacter tibetensis]|uniref:Oxygen sensor histidine kinase NreB n=1 Tax=Hymenobacter tibetensis TaxID=497967 RepID=A0ABY4CS86_9BACT|nr:PAS domain-containing protein [Hymenobacter tibetensis]UOG73099.1 PAS domain-containing protein [Hymenobacter tibetensis]